MTNILMLPARVAKEDNPYISILVRGMRDIGLNVSAFNYSVQSTDVFHVHWLESIFWGRLSRRLNFFAARRARAIIEQARLVRASGGKVFWTVHNITPHESLSDSKKLIWDELCRGFLPLVTDVVVMSEDSIADISNNYADLSDVCFHHIHHPNYVEFFKEVDNVSIEFPHRGGGVRLLMLGRIRPYKKIPTMVESLKRSKVNFTLIVAGDGGSKEVLKIREAIGEDVRFVLIRRVLSHREVRALFEWSEVTLFNFGRILNSGSVLAALSCGRPALCPRSGALSGLADLLGSDWIRTFDGGLDAEWLLSQAAELREISRPSASEALAEFSPCSVAQAHKRIYAC